MHHHHHGHSHSHDDGHHHHHHHHHPKDNKKGLIIALAITSGIMILEFFGGIFTKSLALLSDSGHMLSDASAIALSLFAIWFATKPPSANKTYGFHRFEILAALFNGVTLFVIAFFIIIEAYERFFDPPTVASGTMILIASVGLIANILSAWSLMRKSDVHGNINVRSAYLHILGDALGSVGAIIAGLLMMLFSWYVADPIISVVVALLILRSAWAVVKQTVHILMEGTPVSIDIEEVKHSLSQLEGVLNIHDLHVWSITSGKESLSCHLLIKEEADYENVLKKAINMVNDKFNIQHATVQIEKTDVHPDKLECH